MEAEIETVIKIFLLKRPFPVGKRLGCRSIFYREDGEPVANSSKRLLVECFLGYQALKAF
jgi:hypothetical protein